MSALTAVAMSGGLDSSFVAALLAARGEPVVGLSMLLWDHSDTPRHGRCCGALDLGDAKAVAAQLGIPHYTLRMDDEFRRHVVDPFVDDYASGRTPSPCVRCNTFIKFDALLERARRLGAETVATGHYARIVEGPDGLELHQARDLSKDQSYYLFELDQRQLAAARFPLGELSKEEVRERARDLGLVVAEKAESMELCFVATTPEQFVTEELRQRGETAAAAASAIVDEEGRELGSGAPYYAYTVGQRRGLGIGGGRRLYVLQLEAEHNRITVGSRERLERPGLIGSRAHWIGPEPHAEMVATVRIRARHPGVGCLIRTRADGGVEVRFDEPQTGVAPGQAAVFYDRSRVLGGCWIERASGGPGVDVDSREAYANSRC